jgi:phosphatidylinositol glycan class F
MSSTSVAAAIPTSPAAQTPSQIRSRTITPTTTPVTLLPEPAARAYTHIHPVVVLALYRLRFSNLVADPVPELLRALAALAMLQVGYVVTCLPPTNGRAGRVSEATRSGKVDSKSKSTKRDNRARSVASLSSRITVCAFHEAPHRPILQTMMGG